MWRLVMETQQRSNPWNHHKNAIKDQQPEQSHRGDKQKGNAKERSEDKQPPGTKKKEKASPSHGKKLSHSWPF
jgi:hypothetical protein